MTLEQFEKKLDLVRRYGPYTNRGCGSLAFDAGVALAGHDPSTDRWSLDFQKWEACDECGCLRLPGEKCSWCHCN